MGTFKSFFIILLLFQMSLSQTSLFQMSLISPCFAETNIPKPSWYTGEQKGWLWYKHAIPADFMDESIVSQENKQDESKEYTPTKDLTGTGSFGTTSTEKSHIYTKRLELARKNFDEILAKAVMEPTLENIQMMQQAQNVLVNRATYFSKVWMISSLLSGQNFRPADQPNPQHRKIYQDQLDRELDQKIKNLAKSHGLFFIFKEDGPYCHEFAPIVKKIMNLYGFECKAIGGRPSTSADGKALSLFPEAEIDNGTIAAINPEGIYPSLFLVNPQSRQVIPLARGLVNLSQLRENFKVIIQFLEDGSHGR